MKKILIIGFLFLSILPAQAQWTKKKLTILSWLRSVYFINEDKGWVAGGNGTFLYTLDGGKTWIKKQEFTRDNILDIYFANEKSGWLLCERDIYNLGSQAPSYLLRTSDGGQKWEKIEFSEGTGKERLTRFFFDKYDKGWALGESGSIFKMQDKPDIWKKMPSPTRYLLLDGYFHDAENGVLVGAGGTILFTSNGGEKWNPATLLGNAKNRLNAVFFTDAKKGWIAASEGKIFSTLNGGKTWREQKTNITSDLTDIWFLNNSEGFAIGKDGTILQTQSGGVIWKAAKVNTPHKFERLFFYGKKGFAVGFGGTIFTY